MDLDLVASFTTLVEEAHFGHAARRLHLTSSALTKRIQRLERHLGVTLLERGPAGVIALTAAGQRFAIAAVPLLAQAHAARTAARAEPVGTLRVGFPAESKDGICPLVDRLGIAGVARQIRHGFPGIRVRCIGVPFPALTSCLLERCVDLLWTIAPVQHAGVESFPLAVTSARIGLVGARHPLAQARVLHMADLADQVMLCAPQAPKEWMTPFWLGDMRPRQDARLVETDASDHATVLGHVRRGTAMAGTLEILRPSFGPQLRTIRLTGVPALTFYAARLQTDRRSAVHTLIQAFQALPNPSPATP